MLKLSKYQRDMVYGGLKNARNVKGIDAVKMVLTLEQQSKKYPDDFGLTPQEINYDNLQKCLKAAQAKSMARSVDATNPENDHLQGLDPQVRKIFDKKRRFDIHHYELS